MQEPGGPPLNPAQQEVVDLLGARPDERPEFDPELRNELRSLLADGLGPVCADLDPDDPVWVSKHRLADVHGCEAKYVADQDEPFSSSIATVRGTVTHKAIEIQTHLPGEPHPLEVVDETLARLTEDDRWPGDFLRTLDDMSRAELRSEVNDLLVKFTECWPPLKKEWRPVPESRLRFDLLGGRVVLAGKVDLSLGRPTGMQAGKVLVDLKTGFHRTVHRDDLRFYALVETLKLGVPPRLLATHYLDSGLIDHEDVTDAMLRATVARTVDGVERMIALTETDGELAKKPGPPCQWCPLASDCSEGSAWLAEERPA